MINTPLDQLYLDIMLFTLLGGFTVRVWELAWTMRNVSYSWETGASNHVRSNRIVMLFTCLALMMSVACVATPLIQFGFAGSYELIGQVIPPFRVIGWIVFVVHLLYIPFFSNALRQQWQARNNGWGRKAQWARWYAEQR